MPASLVERFWSKVDRRGPDECWPWTAASNEKGYGRFWLNGRTVPAHRVAYELEVGPIPAHLEPVTHAENLRRANTFDLGSRRRREAAEITHCPAGHPYSGDNLYVSPSGARNCRTCKRERDRARRAA